MSKKVQGNSSGITICDSIVMSVRNKRLNARKPLAVLIAVAGFVSVIMSFLGMFDFIYDEIRLAVVCVMLSAVYITLSVVGKRALWLILGSVIAFGIAAYKKFEEITMGFEYAYNVIYSTAYNTNINYYKYLKPRFEEESVTIMFIFAVWLLAIVIYFFTIYRPNPVFPLLVSFPIIEVGLYNGVEIPIFWGVMTVGYWLALLAMATIDVGEYIGGVGGFVRRDNLFFPKKQMKLKITEECGLLVIGLVLLISGISVGIIKITDYQRSEELNQKRRDISEAMSSFTVDDLAESMANLSSAFGFEFSYDNHKLGTQDHIRYKNTTDLICTFSEKCDTAVYLKEYTGAVYGSNQWKDLETSVYKSELFDDLDEYGLYPQDMPAILIKLTTYDRKLNNLTIDSKLKDNKSFCPYGTENSAGATYFRDSTVSSKSGTQNVYSYHFYPFTANDISQRLGDNTFRFTLSLFPELIRYDDIISFCNEHDINVDNDLLTIETFGGTNTDILSHNGYTIMAELVESEYRDFVYDNYLQVPSNKNMDEIREEYSDILDNAPAAVTPAEKIELLNEIREKMTADSEYTLSPGKTPSNRDFVNYFLLENHKGYCTHYASAGVLLARMAGIPARYATGYVIVGNDFTESSKNKYGNYTINVKDNRSHAWAEIYLDGFGWVPFEFTAGYSDQSIDTNKPKETTAPAATSASSVTTTTAASTQQQSTRERQTTTRTRTTAAAKTVTTEAKASGVAVPGGHGGGSFHIPPAVRDIIIAVLVLAATVMLMLLRRMLILNTREKHFTTASNAKRIAYMYEYAIQLLGAVGIKMNGRSYVEFAKQVEERSCGQNVKRFSEGEFMAFMNTALRSSFSQLSPDSGDVEACRRFVEKLSNNIYEGSGRLRRLSLRYISVLSR